MVRKLNDPETALKDFLETNWNLEDDLAKAKIQFHRTHRRYEESLKAPQAIMGHTTGDQTLTEESMLEGIVRLTVDLVSWAKENSKIAIEAAKTNKWNMKEEVERIVHNVKPLPTDWIIAYVSNFFNLDDEKLTPPIIKERLIVTVHFQRVKTA